MITPEIPNHTLLQFILDHTRQDLKLLRDIFGKSDEDINIIIHMFLKHLMDTNGKNHCYYGLFIRGKVFRCDINN